MKTRWKWGLFILSFLALGLALYPSALQKLYYRVSYVETLRHHASQYQLDPHLVAAIVFTESKFRPQAVSEVGAIGLMQLMPETAADMARQIGLKPPDSQELKNVDLNLRLGCRYFAQLQRRYPDLTYALAAYNAGPGHVESWQREGGEIAFPETRAYVRKVQSTREKLRELYPDW